MARQMRSGAEKIQTETSTTHGIYNMNDHFGECVQTQFVLEVWFTAVEG